MKPIELKMVLIIIWLILSPDSPTNSQVEADAVGKKKIPSPGNLRFSGAEDGIRTRDPNLGKVRYAHFNPNRINLNITE